MIHLGIIGLGTIFKKYQIVLSRMKEWYCIEAVYDIDQKKLKEAKESCEDESIQYYDSLENFLLNGSIDTVLVATPPKTHFELAKRCLCARKNVVLEKPAVVLKKDLELLYDLADQYQCLLNVSYHAAYAKELIWYIRNRSEFEQKHCMGKMKAIICKFFDPYMVDNEILSDKKSIGGSFLDSGVNALSVCSQLVDLAWMSWSVQEESRIVPNDFNTTYQSYSEYHCKGIKISIYTGWNYGLNHKETELIYENGEHVLLNHSLQSAFLIKKNNERERLWTWRGMERLETQYEGVFNDYYCGMHTNASNKEMTLDIHRLLLKDI